ncbi:hypothetical protein V8F06_007397 [Rhypophila decipiens]
MLSSTARPLVARVARRAAIVGQPARSSSQLTTTPSDGAKSKEEEERPAQHDAAKPTIFDLKIETPINKSSEWNISFAPEQAGESPARGQSMRDFRNSRYPPRAATTAGRPIRLPPSNLFSSLAVDRKPFAQTEPLFVSDRWCDEIDEARTMEMLGKLHAEADKPAKQKLAPSATYFPGNRGTHFLPSLDKLPDDIYFRITNRVRLRVGIEAGIKRTRDHEQPRRALPPSATSSATSGGIPYWYYYPQTRGISNRHLSPRIA